MSQLFPPFYPPAYPYADPPPPPVPERLTVNGVDLGSYAYMTTDISGLLSVPARRGDDVVVPGRHGRIRTLGKRFDASEIVLPMWVVGSRPDGSVPSGGPEREFYLRRDHLLQLFHGDSVELEFTRPDSTVLRTTAEVADVMDFTRHWAEPMAKVSVALRLLEPFWTDTQSVSQTITGVTGTTATFTAFRGATAPITDARITFYGPVSNPRLTIADRWVQFNGVIAAGRQLVLECEHWRASPGSGDDWTPDHRQIYREPGPSWMEFLPQRTYPIATFTHTGGQVASVEVAGNRKFLTV